jgi:5-formyltetrahydrofolate cyclo-ligase
VKHKLRKEILDSRLKLPAAERKNKSTEIEHRLFGLREFREAEVVMFFASIQSEVETHGMIRRALAEGKRVVLPKVVKGKQLEAREIRNFDRDTSPGTWGILEPCSGEHVPGSDIGLIVVPGAVFDESGHRIGYGGGYYDRHLRGYHGMTIALAFEMQIVPCTHALEHDIPVKKIVTEKRVIEANTKS